MTTRLNGIALAGLIAALGIAACGGDDGEKDSPAKGEGGKSGSSDSRAVACGPKTCKPADGFMGEMCCQSVFEGTCGQMVAGTCVDLPPDPYEGCDSTTFMAGGNTVMVPSCCTADNQCGLVFNAGIGTPMCTSVTQVRQFGARFMAMAMGMNMMFDFSGNLPEAVTCDGDPIEAPAAGSGG